MPKSIPFQSFLSISLGVGLFGLTPALSAPEGSGGDAGNGGGSGGGVAGPGDSLTTEGDDEPGECTCERQDRNHVLPYTLVCETGVGSGWVQDFTAVLSVFPWLDTATELGMEGLGHGVLFETFPSHDDLLDDGSTPVSGVPGGPWVGVKIVDISSDGGSYDGDDFGPYGQENLTVACKVTQTVRQDVLTGDCNEMNSPRCDYYDITYSAPECEACPPGFSWPSNMNPYAPSF